MKFIFKVLLFLLLYIVQIQANQYTYEETIKLSKDEHKKFLVKHDTSEKLFKFRWTLYSNGGLVVLRSYDRIVAQHMLFMQAKRSTFKVDLTPRGSDYGRVPYVLVKFVEYDYEINKAVFQVFVSDKNSRVSLEHLEDK